MQPQLNDGDWGCGGLVRCGCSGRLWQVMLIWLLPTSWENPLLPTAWAYPIALSFLSHSIQGLEILTLGAK